MKKFLIILCLLVMFLFPAGVNKNNAILGTWELDVNSNYQTWQDLDLSSYTSNKLGKCLLYCEILSGDEGTPTEWVHLKFRPKGETLVDEEETSCFYGTKIGKVEVWTDDDGFVQWYSNYGWPENKTVVLQIKIMININ